MIPLTKPDFDQFDEQNLLQAFRSTFASGDGPDCRAFEKELGAYLGAKHVFFVSSCTAALDLAFMVKDFPAGSEVLVPNFTFTSTALAPILNNLRVVLVDVDPEDGNIDFDDAERKITKNTVAISPVDYAGNPVDIKQMRRLAKDHGLYVVHDAAQSFGAEYEGRKIGTLADTTCFSFHGTKNLVVGEGGALVTEDDELAQKILIARDKGTDKHLYLSDPNKRGYYEYVAKGNSYVQSNLLAAIGRGQLKKIDRLNGRREQIAETYKAAFKDLPGVKLPKITAGAKTNWHLFYMLVPPSIKKDLIESIRAGGVMANIHYSPLHMNRYYRMEEDPKNPLFPNSMKYFDSLIRIPMYPTLTDAEVSRIVDVVRSSIVKLS